MLICTKAYFKKNQRYIKTTYTIYNLILFQKSMLSYQSIVKKQEMTERVKRHPPAYGRKLNMAKRKNQKRRSKKYQVNNRQLKAKRMYKDTIFRMLYHNIVQCGEWKRVHRSGKVAGCYIGKCDLYGNEK